MARKDKGLYLELDAAVDSRMATLAIIDPEAVSRMPPSNYLMRTRDVFSEYGVDHELFTVAYRNRDVQTLKNSVMTAIMTTVQQVIVEYVTTVNANRSGPAEIDLNIYPYNLTAEQCELYAALIEFRLKGVVKVNVIRKEPNQLTLGALDSEYHTAIIYNWVEWACAIEESFKTEACPQLTVIAPNLLHGTDEGLDDPVTVAAFKAAHPTAYMEFALMDKVGITFAPISQFSIIH